jgi:FkbM family methyltransferase
MEALREILAAERLAAAAHVRLRWRDQLTACGCLLFGPGNNGRALAKALARTKDTPNAQAFVSDVPADVGRTVEGLPVLDRAAALACFGADIPVVNCVYRADVTLNGVTRGLEASGFRRVWSLPHMAAAFAGHLPSIYGYGDLGRLEAQADRIIAAHDRLADAQSRRIFRELVAQRISLDFSTERTVDPAIYFPDFLGREDLAAPGAPLVFVDCGAYVGDTLEAFLAWAPAPPARVVALEPDPASFARLKAVADRSSDIEVACAQAAAGASDGRVGFVSLGNEASHVVPDEAGDVAMLQVDTLLAELGERASYIKYDVEGFERDAIAGSRQAIQRDGAALAVSVYHRPDDLWDLLLSLAELRPDYAFRLREHGPDGVDTVLYAIAPR